MNPVAKALFYKGLYVGAMGLLNTLAPDVLPKVVNKLTGRRMLPPPSQWTTALGVIAATLGFYYIHAAIENDMKFAKSSVLGRVFVFCAFASLVFMRKLSVFFLLIGSVDLASALATRRLIRQQERVRLH
mmetsp:Transcript_11746/g.29686  ORF Transcript_11746/g.29686 Transcript_11746/m.29686 type:complete len:130 (-) Transcript_11746:299-688(-)